jgi:hypothetical protein
LKFGQSDLLWLFDIWQLEFNKTLSVGLSLYKALWTLWTLVSQMFCDCSASGGLSSTRRWSRQTRTTYSYGRKAEWWMTECCHSIIRRVNVLRLDHVHQNDIFYKNLWYIAIKTNYGNKGSEDMILPFDTMTARVDDQMEDLQQIINHKNICYVLYSSLGMVLKCNCLCFIRTIMVNVRRNNPNSFINNRY